MKLRTHTQDEMVYEEVVEHNEYELPPRFCLADTILDVGAHVGCFAFACLGRKAGKVICFEPDPANFRLLEQNLKKWGTQAECHERAVWRSDPNEDQLIVCSHGASNTAMPYIGVGKGGTPVEKIGLDAILEKSGRVRLLKLDCEGSEYSVLFTSRRLDLVAAIVGEYHLGRNPVPAVGECNMVGIERVLQENGFEVVFKPHARCPGLQGLFWGRRNTCS